MHALPDPERQIAAVRRFNRFYTQRIGVLRDGYAGGPFSLTEARVLYELSRREQTTASAIGRELGLDAGYLSRMLQRFHKAGLLRKETSPNDARQSVLSLTAKGRKAFAPLEAESNRQVGAMLTKLTSTKQEQLLSALRTAEALLSDAPDTSPRIALREPRVGDLGWVVARHAVLYEQEYGWAGNFEGLCARIVADFAENVDASRERCWIADLDGERAGCVFLVRDAEDVARLRLLLVEPFARGHGIGARLTAECIAFARRCGYRRMTLWTHSVLTAARRTYAKAGFTLTSSKERQSFGTSVVSEHWDLDLSPVSART